FSQPACRRTSAAGQLHPQYGVAVAGTAGAGGAAWTRLCQRRRYRNAAASCARTPGGTCARRRRPEQSAAGLHARTDGAVGTGDPASGVTMVLANRTAQRPSRPLCRLLPRGVRSLLSLGGLALLAVALPAPAQDDF